LNTSQASSRKIIIGLTGSFGSGKTTVAALFKALGARIIDADSIAHELLKPGSRLYRRIKEVFGRDMLNKDSTINRAKLAEAVFNNKKRLAVLNTITHPAIISVISHKIKSCRRGIIILDAPLLLEAGLKRLVNAVIVVTLTRDRQIQRIRRKMPLTRSAIARRIASQMPLREKLRVADFIIDNNGTKGETKKQVKAIWKQLSSIEGGCSGKIRHQ
jgi:dephospho-CoA kinase